MTSGDAEVRAALDELEEVGGDICEYAGHEWCPAGGGLLICDVCTAEKWEDEPDP